MLNPFKKELQPQKRVRFVLLWIIAQSVPFVLQRLDINLKQYPLPVDHVRILATSP
jgi:hypothetical protein